MKVVYDAVLKRPGCALLQAALGGTNGIADLFPLDSWLLAPTDDLRLYEINEGRLGQLITITENALSCRLAPRD
jgi:hypothetical protein